MTETQNTSSEEIQTSEPSPDNELQTLQQENANLKAELQEKMIVILWLSLKQKIRENVCRKNVQK